MILDSLENIGKNDVALYPAGMPARDYFNVKKGEVCDVLSTGRPCTGNNSRSLEKSDN